MSLSSESCKSNNRWGEGGVFKGVGACFWSIGGREGGNYCTKIFQGRQPWVRRILLVVNLRLVHHIDGVIFSGRTSLFFFFLIPRCFKSERFIEKSSDNWEASRGKLGPVRNLTQTSLSHLCFRQGSFTIHTSLNIDSIIYSYKYIFSFREHITPSDFFGRVMVIVVPPMTVVAVLTLTRVIMSVVTWQAPVTLELEEYPGKKHKPKVVQECTVSETQFMPPPETYKKWNRE